MNVFAPFCIAALSLNLACGTESNATGPEAAMAEGTAVMLIAATAQTNKRLWAAERITTLERMSVFIIMM
jgi:hypothetical protein